MRRMSSDTITRDQTETLPILIAPHATLKARARSVGPADEAEIRDLIPRMFATMYRAPGIGLAAVQVGRLLRVVTIDLMPDEKPAPLVQDFAAEIRRVGGRVRSPRSSG